MHIPKFVIRSTWDLIGFQTTTAGIVHVLLQTIHLSLILEFILSNSWHALFASLRRRRFLVLGRQSTPRSVWFLVEIVRTIGKKYRKK